MIVNESVNEKKDQKNAEKKQTMNQLNLIVFYESFFLPYRIRQYSRITTIFDYFATYQIEKSKGNNFKFGSLYGSYNILMINLARVQFLEILK